MNKSLAVVLFGVPLYLIHSTGALASCAAPVPVQDGSTVECADTRPVAGFAYQLTNPTGVHSDNVDIVSEGQTADGRVQISADWSDPGMIGCPIEAAGPQRIMIIVQGNDGKGALVSLSGVSTDPGSHYIVDYAHKYDPTTGLPLPLPSSASAPTITSQSSSGGILRVDLHFRVPVVFTDCDPDSFGVLAGHGTCPDNFMPVATLGRIFMHTGACTTAPDLQRDSWTDTGVLPDASGNAHLTWYAPGDGECQYFGNTTNINGFESGGITGFVTIAGCLDNDHDGVTDCQGDCDDFDPARYPGHPEVCDGIDNDCNGIADDGIACVGACFPPITNPDVPVSNNAPFMTSPSLAWSVSEFGVVWSDLREGVRMIFGARLDSTGSKIGSDVRIPAYLDTSVTPVIAWSGSEYGVAWSQKRVSGIFDIWFRRLAPDFTPLSGDIQITSSSSGDASRPSIVWTGSGYGLAWDRNGEIYFARLDPMGATVGDVVQITNAANSQLGPDIVWTGTQYGVAWLGGGDVYFVGVSSAGDKIGTETRVTSVATGSGPSLVWNGAGYGVAWGDSRDGQGVSIYFARLDASGVRIGPEVRVDSDPSRSFSPKLAWNGSEYGVFWQDLREGTGKIEIYYIGLTAQGVRIDTDFRVTNGAQASPPGKVLYTGTEYAMVWSGTIGLLQGIGFSRIGCPCVDLDGDGFTSCNDCDDGRVDVFPGAPEICDGLDNNCDGLVDEGPAGADPDSDGVPSACDNCPTIPNADQDPGACDQRVEAITLLSASPLGHGSGTVTWMTTHEVDVSGFNLVALDAQMNRTPLNPVPIGCEECTTGGSHTYAYFIPKHKSGKNLYIELIRSNGVIELWGPAIKQ